jgi:heme/copper-type cytochrome/quinol oxidase subunit 2
MKNLDIILLTVIFALWIYAFMTPGYQLMPPYWKVEERMNWKPTPIFWVTLIVIGVYVLKK